MVGSPSHSQGANTLWVGLQELGSHHKRFLLHLKSRQMLMKASSLSALSVGENFFHAGNGVPPWRAQEVGRVWRCCEAVGAEGSFALGPEAFLPPITAYGSSVL